MMKNRNLGIAFQFIGLAIIVESVWSFISSIMAAIEFTRTFLDVFGLFFTYLLNFPFLFIGIFFIWLGKRLNTNDVKAEEDENQEKNKSTAKGTKTFGWMVILLASIYTLLGFNTTNDAEGQAYRLLLVIPGAIAIVIGLIIVWIGVRGQKNIVG